MTPGQKIGTWEENRGRSLIIYDFRSLWVAGKGSGPISVELAKGRGMGRSWSDAALELEPRRYVFLPVTAHRNIHLIYFSDIMHPKPVLPPLSYVSDNWDGAG